MRWEGSCWFMLRGPAGGCIAILFKPLDGGSQGVPKGILCTGIRHVRCVTTSLRSKRAPQFAARGKGKPQTRLQSDPRRVRLPAAAAHGSCIQHAYLEQLPTISRAPRKRARSARVGIVEGCLWLSAGNGEGFKEGAVKGKGSQAELTSSAAQRGLYLRADCAKWHVAASHSIQAELNWPLPPQHTGCWFRVPLKGIEFTCK